MPGLKLKVRQTDLHPNSCRAWLDDHEITTGLTGLTLTLAPMSDIPRAEIAVTLDDIDIDAATLAVFQAYADAKVAA